MGYQPEVCLPDGTLRETPDTVDVNNDLFQTYKRLIHLRRHYPTLSLGGFQTILTDDRREIYVYSRSFQAQALIVAFPPVKHSS